MRVGNAQSPWLAGRFRLLIGPALLIGLVLSCGAAAAAQAAAAVPPARSGDRLVVFQPGASDADVDGWLAAQASQGGRVIYRFHSIRGVWVRFETGPGSAAAAGSGAALDAALRSSPLVARVASDGMGETDLVPDDPLYVQQWNLRNRAHPLVDVQAEPAWDLTAGDSTVVIAVLDTGVDPTHPDLAPILVPGWDCWDWDADPSPTPLTNNNWHGTYVAGVAAAAGNNGEGIAGVGWRTHVMPFKVGPGGISLFATLTAFDMCIQRHVDVINCSFHFLPPDTTDLRYYVRAANNAGIAVCASAGNTEGLNIDLPGNDRYPANFNYPLVVTVGSYESTGVPFNSFGPLTVDIAAPGSDIVGTTGPAAEHGLYFTGSGTSGATAQVAGAIALVKSRYPGSTGAFAVNRVLGRAETSSLLQGRVAGNRRLNLYRAVADPDTVAPGAITDLHVVGVRGDSATVAWTASGEDGALGTVDYVDLRWAVNTPIDDNNQEDASRPATPITPLPPGSLQQFTIRGVSPVGETLYVRLRVFDEQRNPSPASTLDFIIPAPQIAVTSRYLSQALFSGETAQQTVTISNAGIGDLSVQAVPADTYPWLTVTPSSPITVAPGGQSVLAFHFSTVGVCAPPGGELLGTINLVHDGVNEASPLPIQAVLAPRDTCRIAVSATTVDFGAIPIDSTRVRHVTIHNRGCRPLHVTAADTSAAVWLTAAPDTFAVAPGDSQVMTLTAHPTQIGALATTVLLHSDDPLAAALRIAVQGTARARLIAVTSRRLFKTLLSGQVARDTVTITNAGNDDLHVQAQPTGTYGWLTVAPASPFIVPPGGHSILTFAFSAVGVCAPPDTLFGTVDLVHDGMNETSPLPIQAVFAPRDTSRIAVSDTTFDFGVVLIDSTGVRSLTVHNRGCRTLHVTAADTAAAAWLTASPDTFAVAVGDSQLVTLTAHPTASGSLATTVLLHSDDPLRADIAIVIQGNARYPTGIPGLPTVLRLYQNQPNPFNPSTTLRFDLPAAGSVRICIFDLGGRLVRELVNRTYPAGSHSAFWNGRDDTGRSLASGSYFARMEAGRKVQAVRLSLIK